MRNAKLIEQLIQIKKELEKKLWEEERRKFEDARRQEIILKTALWLIDRMHWACKSCEGCINKCPGWLQDKRLAHKEYGVCKYYTTTIGGK